MCKAPPHEITTGLAFFACFNARKFGRAVMGASYCWHSTTYAPAMSGSSCQS